MGTTMKTLLVTAALLLLVSCTPTKSADLSPACKAALAELTQRDLREGSALIASGACDDYTYVLVCPEYQQHRAKYDALAAALEVCQ